MRTRKSKAESSAETRTALLDAGATLLREQPVGQVLDQVKAAEVARRAGRTVGAFYHHWPDQESYQRELLEFVFAPARTEAGTAAINAGTRDAQAGVMMEEVVRRRAREDFDAVSANPYLGLSLALWAKHTDDGHVRNLLAGQYRAVTAELVEAYEQFFEFQGWEPRPPFTIEMFAVTLTALVEGLVIRAAVDPDAVPRELPTVQSGSWRSLDGNLDQGPWDLFGIVVLALIPSMTVPKIRRDPDLWSDYEDVRGLVRRLRETHESMAGQWISTGREPSDGQTAEPSDSALVQTQLSAALVEGADRRT